MRLLIGIDDTDVLESRGTGFLARELVAELGARGLAVGRGISRHQLLVDSRIPYTSHNSSACLEVDVRSGLLAQVGAACRRFLVERSAPGADAGLCVARWPAVSAAIRDFGRRAKLEIVAAGAAFELASAAGIELAGLTGTGGGAIGALAAVGLRADGNDGRYLWLPGLRELAGIHTSAEVRRLASVAAVRTLDGRAVPDSSLINVGDWARPILRDGHSVLMVEEENDGGSNWRVAPRELIKRESD